ncbi:hypothetical protein NECAME_16246 [Necator americanus]|uniref:Uncharacterized protein n=1 Tax=Necator americanus TaxID=51031 RepID=W2TX35_NECAM|nr:hypothetical protein NECAME_16246 [Necator americanus]ETN86645.1 hypothetical protein NECAME_16246 [Necator americanus]
MAERGFAVDHSTVHRWAEAAAGAGESVPATQAAGGQKLARGRDLHQARRYFEKAIAQNCVPETVTIDKRGANLAAFKDIKVVNQIIGYVYFVYRY